ncbi:MAG: linearmycin/streptolysin transport system ATP-binding protein [Acidobacteriaceae bacterium]|jgi:ABC-2 type transport system ATP-binding protein
MMPITNILAVELENPQQVVRVEEIRTIPGVQSADLKDGLLRVGVQNLSAETPAVLGWLATHGHSFRHVVSERPDLEAVFLSLTGRSLRDS